MTTKIKSGVIGDNVVGITQLNVSDGTNGQVLITDGAGTLSFSTISGYTDSDVETYLNTSEIYTDATNNRLGIGTASPQAGLDLGSSAKGTWSSGNVYSYPTGNAYIKIQGTSAEHNWIGIAGAYGATSGSANLMLQANLNNTSQQAGSYIGSEAQSATTADITFGKLVGGSTTSTNATKSEFARIDSSGNVGIGETTPLGKLHIKSGDSAASSVNGNANELVVENSDYTGITILGENETSIMFGDNEDPDVGRIEYFHSTNTMSFRTNGSDAMKINSSGNVGIGITNPAHTLSVYKAGDGQTPLRLNTGNNEPLDFYNDSETWKIHAAQGIGFMAKGTGLITFYTTDSETECARWTNNRAFKTKQGTSAYANATSNYNEICSNTGATANLLIRQGSTYYADCVNLWYYGGTPNDANSNFLNAFDSTATRAKIFSNGGFANYQSNDSNLCDEREKKNIVASNSTWNDVKSWNIKTFHYNEDDDSDAKRYGVIAQDIEITNPDLIVDWEKQQSREEELWQEEDRPLPEGVSVGDVKEPAQAQVMRKAVKEQQMYIMAIKALQEAMTEIEDLKSRIETLEG